jgi:hypothetical protein
VVEDAQSFLWTTASHTIIFVDPLQGEKTDLGLEGAWGNLKVRNRHFWSLVNVIEELLHRAWDRGRRRVREGPFRGPQSLFWVVGLKYRWVVCWGYVRHLWC